MLMTSTFWFLVAFVLFFILFGRAIWRLASSGLDDRSRKIEEDIEEAMQLRDEAQATLNEIKNKHMQAEQHARAIMEHAKVEAKRLRSEATQELDDFLKNREALVEQRIKYAENEAVREIRDSAVQLAIQASEKILSAAVSEKADKEIIERAIDELRTASNSR